MLVGCGAFFAIASAILVAAWVVVSPSASGPSTKVVGEVACDDGSSLRAVDGVEPQPLGRETAKWRSLQLVHSSLSSPAELKVGLAPYDAWRPEAHEPRVVLRGSLDPRVENTVIRPSGIAEGRAPTVLSIHLGESSLPPAAVAAARACIQSKLDELILAVGKHKVFTGEADVKPFVSKQYAAVVLWSEFVKELEFHAADGQYLSFDRNGISWHAPPGAKFTVRGVGAIGEDQEGRPLIFFDASELAVPPAGVSVDLDFASYVDASGNTVRSYFAEARLASAGGEPTKKDD